MDSQNVANSDLTIIDSKLDLDSCENSRVKVENEEEKGNSLGTEVEYMKESSDSFRNDEKSRNDSSLRLMSGRLPIQSVHVCDSQIANIINVKSKRFRKRLEAFHGVIDTNDDIRNEENST